LAALASAQPGVDVVVVDDGAVDRPRDVAAAGGATVLSLPFNLGVGSAVRAGLHFARDRGFDRAVVFDADGQHDPRAIDDLLAALDAGADIALASRFAAGTDSYPVGRVRKSAMRFMAGFVARLTHQRFTDPTSGFRAFDRSAIELLSRVYPVEYLADTVEVLLIAASAGLRLQEIPSSMKVRSLGVPSTRRFRLIANYLRVLVGLMGAAAFRAPYRRVNTARRPPEDTA
jgi:glycosyltransferase involved in cell wall biosynthesis